MPSLLPLNVVHSIFLNFQKKRKNIVDDLLLMDKLYYSRSYHWVDIFEISIQKNIMENQMKIVEILSKEIEALSRITYGT